MDPSRRPPRTARPRPSLRWLVLGAFMVLVLVLAGCAVMWHPALAPGSQAGPASFDAPTMERGRQLAALGSCAAWPPA